MLCACTSSMLENSQCCSIMCHGIYIYIYTYTSARCVCILEGSYAEAQNYKRVKLQGDA